MRARLQDRLGRSTYGSWKSGSAVMFALFACLVASVSVQMLVAAVVCAQRALFDEESGRNVLAAIDACLASKAADASVEWAPSTWKAVEVDEVAALTRLTEVDQAFEWTLSAEVRDGMSEKGAVTSGLVERGRDGLDLPRAVAVADRVRVADGRLAPWVVSDDETVFAFVREVQEGSSLAQDCEVRRLETSWSLGEGWGAFLEEHPQAGSRVLVETGERGQILTLRDLPTETSRDDPVLIAVVGGADLDLRGLGDVWGVVVADGASLFLEGTAVHGAVYVSERVELGGTGQVVFDECVWQWARDRSLVRIRLVPGSRHEGTS